MHVIHFYLDVIYVRLSHLLYNKAILTYLFTYLLAYILTYFIGVNNCRMFHAYTNQPAIQNLQFCENIELAIAIINNIFSFFLISAPYGYYVGGNGSSLSTPTADIMASSAAVTGLPVSDYKNNRC